MASTRIRDDLGRKQEQVQHSIYACNYAINAPGNGGTTPDYMEDPHIRAQKWGANLMTNAVDLESSLKGIRPLGQDCLGKDEYTNYTPNSQSQQYPSNDTLYTEQPRAIAPAWEIRQGNMMNTREQPYLFLDPQEEPKINFHTETSTRILEKDMFHPNSLQLKPDRLEDLLPHIPNRK